MDVCIEGCVVVCVYTGTTCDSVCAVLHYSAFRDSCPKTFFFFNNFAFAFFSFSI